MLQEPTCPFTPRHKSISDARSEASTDIEDREHLLNTPEGRNSYCNEGQSSGKAKSSLCKNFTEKGYCPYGGRCQFAHGPQELRINMETNRSYKTKGCHAFTKKGYCCYGDRCNFIHLPELAVPQKWTLIYRNHRQTINLARHPHTSRLAGLLPFQSL